jgi:hypothetical protein
MLRAPNVEPPGSCLTFQRVCWRRNSYYGVGGRRIGPGECAARGYRFFLDLYNRPEWLEELLKILLVLR